jgi:hypothetical protein
MLHFLAALTSAAAMMEVGLEPLALSAVVTSDVDYYGEFRVVPL